MEIRNYLTELYTYNDWANATLFQAMEEQSVQIPEIDRILSHLVAAQLVWIQRVHGEKPSISAYGLYPFEELKTIHKDSTDRWMDLIKDGADEQLFGEISYKNSKGDAYTSPVMHIACHLVNHASYHRGQIAKLMRQAGHEPVNTDFIGWSRITRA